MPPSRDDAPAPQEAVAYDDGKAGRLSGFCSLRELRWCNVFGGGLPMASGARLTGRQVLPCPRRHRQAKAAIFDRSSGAAGYGAKKKSRAMHGPFYKVTLSSALTGFEPALGFVDNVNPALTANDTAIAVALLQGAK